MTDQPERFTPPPQGYQPPTNPPPQGYQPPTNPPPGTRDRRVPAADQPAATRIPAAGWSVGISARAARATRLWRARLGRRELRAAGGTGGQRPQHRHVDPARDRDPGHLHLRLDLEDQRGDEATLRRGCRWPPRVRHLPPRVAGYLVPRAVRAQQHGSPCRSAEPGEHDLGLWFLLPIIGSFVWFIRVQGQLNDYWRSRGATG